MKMLFCILPYALVLATVGCTSGERWRWPEDAVGEDSVRIDTKVGFVDDQGQRNGKRSNLDNVQADEVSFEQPTDTQGFYNRPPGSGRYPVRVEGGRQDQEEIRINGPTGPTYLQDRGERSQRYQSDGTLDSLQYCKCVSSAQCPRKMDYSNSCGAGQYLCCYDGPAKQNTIQSEYFNEVDDERPMLYPSRPGLSGPFPPLAADNSGAFRPAQGILVGPEGPTGVIGISKNQALAGSNGPKGYTSNKPVLVGPQGPTGVIGPANDDRDNLLVRPLGSKDVAHSGTAQRGILVGPGGPTGMIGPAFNRPVLVGPRGPTGIIGPAYNRPVLVGPNGPSGTIGPRFVGQGGPGFGRSSPGLLVGPGGPTGIIGPGRQILVGPGGPTGRIGPRNYFGI